MITLPEGYNYSATIGYVVLPTDRERNEYIVESLKTCTITVMCNDSMFVNRVPISPIDIGFIEFPEKVGEIGTPLLLINNPVDNKYSVACIYRNPNDIQELQENQFKFRRSWEDDIVEITGSAREGYIGIVLNSDSKRNLLYINLRNRKNKGKFRVNVQGDIEVYTQNNNILATNSQKFTTRNIDEDTESLIEQTPEKNFFSSKENHIEGEVIKHNSGSEPMVLGNTLAKKMVQILEEITKITVPTALGPSGVPINTPQFIKIRSMIDEIKSSISSLD